MRRLLSALLILLVPTGNLALATEKASSEKAKTAAQPAKPILQLVHVPDSAPPKSETVAGNLAVGRPDLLLQTRSCVLVPSSPTSFYWSCWFEIKNGGTSQAAASKLTLDGSGAQGCAQGQVNRSVPLLAAGAVWAFNWSVRPGCTTKATLDALNQVWESDEKNNVYTIH